MPLPSCSDHARRRSSERRGGTFDRLDLDEVVELFQESTGDLLALDVALDELARARPELARVVELRFFAGMKHPEIARVLDAEYRKIPVPFAPLDLLARVCESVCQPLGVQPPIYPRRLDFYRHDECFSTARAAQELGWKPKHTLPEGLRKTAEAYREQELL